MDEIEYNPTAAQRISETPMVRNQVSESKMTINEKLRYLEERVRSIDEVLDRELRFFEQRLGKLEMEVG